MIATTAEAAEKVSAVTVNTASNLRIQIDGLLATTSLGEHVVDELVEGMFGRDVTTYRPGPLPVSAWSSGEQALWLFLASVVGTQPVNLYGLASQFAGTPEGGHIALIMQTLMTEGI